MEDDGRRAYTEEEQAKWEVRITMFRERCKGAIAKVDAIFDFGKDSRLANYLAGTDKE
jgi:hypothetical protein